LARSPDKQPLGSLHPITRKPKCSRAGDPGWRLTFLPSTKLHRVHQRKNALLSVLPFRRLETSEESGRSAGTERERKALVPFHSVPGQDPSTALRISATDSRFGFYLRSRPLSASTQVLRSSPCAGMWPAQGHVPRPRSRPDEEEEFRFFLSAHYALRSE